MALDFTRDFSNQEENNIIGYYHQLFGRDPDAAGLQYWKDTLADDIDSTSAIAKIGGAATGKDAEMFALSKNGTNPAVGLSYLYNQAVKNDPPGTDPSVAYNAIYNPTKSTAGTSAPGTSAAGTSAPGTSAAGTNDWSGYFKKLQTGWSDMFNDYLGQMQKQQSSWMDSLSRMYSQMPSYYGTYYGSGNSTGTSSGNGINMAAYTRAYNAAQTTNDELKKQLKELQDRIDGGASSQSGWHNYNYSY